MQLPGASSVTWLRRVPVRVTGGGAAQICLRLAIGAFSAAAIALAVGATSARVDAHEGHDSHQDHRKSDAQPATTRKLVEYAVPSTPMTRHDDIAVDIADELRSAQPVFLNFIYTSCTSVCPLMSQTFAGLQEELGTRAASVKMISVSIDPEQDTPARLADYARALNAGSAWRFYTGSVEASIQLQKSFDVYTPDKMSHAVTTFFREAPGRPWLRIDGFVSPDELVVLARKAR